MIKASMMISTFTLVFMVSASAQDGRSDNTRLGGGHRIGVTSVAFFTCADRRNAAVTRRLASQGTMP
jgi:hypothetical protein